VISNYDGQGLSFVYPENWKVEESTDEWPREILLQSPSGAFLSLHLYATGSSEPELVEQALQSIRAEYEERDIEALPFKDSLVIDGPKARGYNVSFSLLDFIVQAQVRCFRHADYVILTMCQAEDREFDQLEQVFLAILWSLIHPQTSNAE